METLWEVVGYETFTSVNQHDGIRLYCSRMLQSENGEGTEVRSFTFWSDRNNYQPVIGHRVIPMLDRNDRYVEKFVVINV